MAISQEYLEMAETGSLKHLICIRMNGERKRRRGEFTSYTHEETGADVDAIRRELHRREDVERGLIAA